MASRRDGELWISKETPHTLKYYAGGTEFWATSATTYEAGESIKKGQVLAISRTSSEKVVRAQWPDDLNDVIGIALNDAELTYDVRVVSYGYIDFTRAELENLFITRSDITVGSIATGTNYYTAYGTTGSDDGGAGNGWSDTASVFSGLGAPLYLYQGRSIKTGASTYAMQTPGAGDSGKLTFATPSGYKYPSTGPAWADSEYDVAYQKLPIVGNVYSYTFNDVSKEIETMVVHINFSKFDRKTEFVYPASGLYNYDSVNDPETIPVRHGLYFSSQTLLPHTSVTMLGSADSDIDGEILEVRPGYESTKADGITTVTIKSDSSFYGKIIGEVDYVL